MNSRKTERSIECIIMQSSLKTIPFKTRDCETFFNVPAMTAQREEMALNINPFFSDEN